MDKKIEELSKELYIEYQENFDIDNKVVRTSGKVLDKDEVTCMIDAVIDGNLTAGKYADAFTKELKKYTGIKNVILTNSGSSSNLLGLASLCSVKLGEKRLTWLERLLKSLALITYQPIIND